MPGARFNENDFRENVHTVHLCFLFINIRFLGSEWFEAGCTPVCTFGDYPGQDDKKRPKPLCVT